VPAYITLVDRDGRLKAVNQPLAKALRMPASTLEGRPLRDVVGKRLYAIAEPYIARALQGEEVTFEANVRMHDGEHDLLEHYVPERDEDGQVIGFYTMALDITERKRAERHIAGSERRMRTIADNLPVLIAYIGADRRYQLCNQTYTDWFGKPASELEGVHHDDLSPSPARRTAVTEALKGKRTEMEEEWTFLTGTRHVHSVYIPDIEPDGTVRGLHGLTTDVTATKLNELRLANLARHDALTGLPNRRHFEEVLDEAVARAKRSLRPMALLFLDIDHFKQINDTHGHEAGDEVLQAFATRLRSAVRSTDTVSRLAGDEFTVILEGLMAEHEAETVALKITEAIKPRVMLKSGCEIALSSSIGVAVYNAEAGDPATLVGTADRALYAAKAAGRATHRTLKVA
jgi:diguanylate cyclase (GGDEF)-like protein/PAS domain S-box-containing protein